MMKYLVGRKTVFIAFLIIAALVPFFGNAYHLLVATTLMIFIMLAVGMNVLLGYAGQLAFANAAMFGIGAYGTGLLQVHFGMPFWFAFPIGALIATFVGTLIALPALRMSGLYLALSTLAFAQFAQWVFLHWESVTFGAGGFKTPVMSFGSLPVSKPVGLYFLSMVLMVLMVWFANNMIKSRIGRAFVMVRDSEVAAGSLGVDLLRYKVLAFGISGFYAGIAGGLYSQLLNFVSPEGYDLFQMVIQKSMIVIGGLGSIAGSVIGASVVIILIEVLREFKGAQEIAFGSLLLLCVIFFRGGIVSVVKRSLPGWEEPLHGSARKPHVAASASATSPVSQEGTA